jgi:hypothetical protein
LELKGVGAPLSGLIRSTRLLTFSLFAMTVIGLGIGSPALFTVVLGAVVR